jgi:Na+/phosphate symporter
MGNFKLRWTVIILLCTGSAFFFFLKDLLSVDPNAVSEDDLRQTRRLAGGAVLGQLDHIEIHYGTLSMLIILAAVISIEIIFHHLHVLTAETPFRDIISAIEKELMVVGGIAFILKCIINSSKIPKHWYIAIEFIGR